MSKTQNILESLVRAVEDRVRDIVRAELEELGKGCLPSEEGLNPTCGSCGHARENHTRDSKGDRHECRVILTNESYCQCKRFEESEDWPGGRPEGIKGRIHGVRERKCCDRDKGGGHVGPCFNLMKQCQVPPPGWVCSRAAGHEGACAATRAFFGFLFCSRCDSKVEEENIADGMCPLCRDEQHPATKEAAELRAENERLGGLVMRQAEQLLRCSHCGDLKDEGVCEVACPDCDQTQQLRAGIEGLIEGHHTTQVTRFEVVMVRDLIALLERVDGRGATES